jgi:hypothetical protein
MKPFPCGHPRDKGNICVRYVCRTCHNNNQRRSKQKQAAKERLNANSKQNINQ